MTGMTLVEFLLARLDEDEQAARAMAEVFPPPWDLYDRGHSARVVASEPAFLDVASVDQEQAPRGTDRWPGEFIQHIARHDPTRVLAEVAAKRAILARLVDTAPPYADSRQQEIHETLRDEVVEHLAAVYAEHPDYRQEWAP